jgi:hypothetical protein
MNMQQQVLKQELTISQILYEYGKEVHSGSGAIFGWE